MLTADQMRALPDVFRDIPDPRRAQGRRHRLPTVLAIAAAAVLCGMRGYQAIADWAHSLGPKARQRFRCRRSQDGRYVVPSESIFRDCLIRSIRWDRHCRGRIRPCVRRFCRWVRLPARASNLRRLRPREAQNRNVMLRSVKSWPDRLRYMPGVSIRRHAAISI